jgi:hypothetical protein
MEVNLLKLDGTIAEFQLSVTNHLAVNLYDQVVVICPTKAATELWTKKSLFAVIVKVLAVTEVFV